MKVITEGHQYEVANYENQEANQIIQFVHKEANLAQGENEMVTVNDGTTNEELLAMLIDRMYYLQRRFPCRENSIVITNLEESLMWLNKRTADRIARNVEGKYQK